MNKLYYLIDIFKKNRFLFAFVLLLAIVFYTFLFCHPFYQCCDDSFLKDIVSGNYSIHHRPFPYMMWSNTFYGLLLTKLYSFSDKVYWYDFMTYLYMSLSVFACAIVLFKKEKVVFNIFLFFTLFFIYSMVFVYPQFTITSSCLFILSFMMLVYCIKNVNINRVMRFTLYGVAFISATFSSMVRFEEFLFMLPLALLVICFNITKKNKKQVLEVILVSVVIVFSSLFLEYKNQQIIKNNPVYNRLNQENIARLNLTERTFAFDNLSDYAKPWRPIENQIPDLSKKLSQESWNIGTYRCLFYFLNIGDENLYNLDKLKKVYSTLKDDITVKKTNFFHFKLGNFFKTFKYYLTIMFLLILLSNSKKSVVIKGLSIIGFIYLYLFFVGNFTKLIPPRVWTGLIMLGIISLFTFIPNIKIKLEYFRNFFLQYVDINGYKAIMLLFFALCTLFFINTCYKPIKGLHNKTEIMNSSYKAITQYLTELDKSKIYFTDEFTYEIFSAPFRKGLFEQNVKFIQINCNGSNINKERMIQYGLPIKKDTLLQFVNSDKYRYFAIVNAHYSNFYIESNMEALKSFYKDNYNINTVFVSENNSKNNIRVFRVKSLGQKEIDYIKIYEIAKQIFEYR